MFMQMNMQWKGMNENVQNFEVKSHLTLKFVSRLILAWNLIMTNDEIAVMKRNQGMSMLLSVIMRNKTNELIFF